MLMGTGVIPGRVRCSCCQNPTVASIAARPCLSSASRSHFISNRSENPKGSNSTSPTHPFVLLGASRKGTDLLITPVVAAGGASTAFDEAKLVGLVGREVYEVRGGVKECSVSESKMDLRANGLWLSHQKTFLNIES